MSHRLGNLEPFVSHGTALGERAQLGMAHGEPGTGTHGGQHHLAEALVAPCPVEGRHSLSEAVDRPTIVPLALVGSAEIAVRQRVQDGIPASRSERESTLARGDGLVICAHEIAVDCQRDRDLSEPTRVVEGLGDGPSLAQTRQDTPRVAKRSERRTQGEPEINGLLTRVALLRQMRESAKRLLEVSPSFAVGRARHGFLPRLPAVCHRLVPHLTAQGMVGEPFDLLSHPVPGERFQGLDDPGV